LGSNGGAAEIKKHKFFKDINWATALAKGIDPVVKPKIKSLEIYGYR